MCVIYRGTLISIITLKVICSGNVQEDLWEHLFRNKLATFSNCKFEGFDGVSTHPGIPEEVEG